MYDLLGEDLSKYLVVSKNNFISRLKIFHEFQMILPNNGLPLLVKLPRHTFHRFEEIPAGSDLQNSAVTLFSRSSWRGSQRLLSAVAETLLWR